MAFVPWPVDHWQPQAHGSHPRLSVHAQHQLLGAKLCPPVWRGRRRRRGLVELVCQALWQDSDRAEENEHLCARRLRRLEEVVRAIDRDPDVLGLSVSPLVHPVHPPGEVKHRLRLDAGQPGDRILADVVGDRLRAGALARHLVDIGAHGLETAQEAAADEAVGARHQASRQWWLHRLPYSPLHDWHFAASVRRASGGRRWGRTNDLSRVRRALFH